MRRAALLLLLLLAPAAALADDVRESFSLDHPFAIGGRASSWMGGYFAPSLGGHLKFRPWEWIGVETFSDNFLRVQEDAWRHDHVIGFSLYAPSLIGNDVWYLAPSFGMCVDFRFAHPKDDDRPSTSDILFGMHGGLMFERYVAYGFAFEANATLYAYLGHESSVERWSATLSNELHVTPIALVTAGINYYF